MIRSVLHPPQDELRTANATAAGRAPHSCGTGQADTVTPPLRLLAVDDEPLALQHVRWSLQQVAGVELVATARDAASARKAVETEQPDVVLLDIEMPGIDGLELAASLRADAMPVVIFLTAFDEFAIKAFDLSAADYVLKPIELDRLATALGRARAVLDARRAGARLAEFEGVVAQLRHARRLAREAQGSDVWVREGGTRIRIPLRSIDRIQAYGDYVRLYEGSRTRLMRAKLNELAKRLETEAFVRIHRSEIVRQDFIQALRRGNSGCVMAVLRDGSVRPISKRYRAAVYRALRMGPPTAV